jgi:thiol-disulfide isomerase/thioredoxin
MKNYFISALSILLLLSCSNSEESGNTSNDSKDVNYVILKGNVKNFQNDSISILTNGDFAQVLKINEAGDFNDTLYIDSAINSYYFQHAQQYAALFLKKGYALEMNMDYNDFDNSLTFNGEGSNENSLILQITKTDAQEDIYALTEIADSVLFAEGVSKYVSTINSLLDNAKDVDQKVVELQKEILQSKVEELNYYRDMVLKENALFAILNNNPSPEFIGYETTDGSKKSLKDFLGKYIYIDVWATWCGPCLAETPYLKKIHEEYQGKNLSILSISVDNQKDKTKWVDKVSHEELVWNNVIADNDFSSEFIQAYGINSIPRFIILDPKGNVVDAGAPRPSSDEIRPLLDSLLSK